VKPLTILKTTEKPKNTYEFLGSSDKVGANRNVFGDAVVEILGSMDETTRKDSVLVVDSDLEGSCGSGANPQSSPRSLSSVVGIQERGNLSAAAGFGMEKGKQGIFATFSCLLGNVYF
jgi:transketolase C-terminal domain/subunit